MRIPEQTAEVTMRNIREGGMMTSGARGVNAPDMTYLDASRTLIAQIAEENPGRRAIGHVRDFGGLPWANPAPGLFRDIDFSLQAILPEEDTGTFELALAALIRVFAEFRDDPRVVQAGTRLRNGGWKKPSCRVEIYPHDRGARIIMAGAMYDFGELTSVADWAPGSDEETRLGRQSICFVNQEVIGTIADGFIGGGRQE